MNYVLQMTLAACGRQVANQVVHSWTLIGYPDSLLLMNSHSLTKPFLHSFRSATVSYDNNDRCHRGRHEDISLIVCHITIFQQKEHLSAQVNTCDMTLIFSVT